jgi:predicted dehydrogenase
MEAAREMLALARRKNLIFAVTQQRRYDANLQAWKAFLKSGELGPVHTLYCDFFMPIFPRNGFNWVRNPLLLDMAIHTFDAARCILGADAKTAYCREFNPPQSPMHRGGSAVAIFEMSNNVTYEYRGSWANVGLNTTWESSWLAQGTKGSSAWDGAKCFRTQVVSGKRGWGMKLKNLKVPTALGPKSGGHVGLIREFIKCIRSGKKPETDASDNIKSLAMVFAAIKSAETGEKVKV